MGRESQFPRPPTLPGTAEIVKPKGMYKFSRDIQSQVTITIQATCYSSSRDAEIESGLSYYTSQRLQGNERRTKPPCTSDPSTAFLLNFLSTLLSENEKK